MNPVIDILRRRWRILVLGGLITGVAIVWALFPTLLGGAPDALGSEEVALTEIACQSCTFFDLDSVDLTREDGRYSSRAYQEELESGGQPTWAVISVPTPEIGFTVGNTTADTEVLLTGIALRVVDHETVSGRVDLGCLPPGQPTTSAGGDASVSGAPVEAVGFSIGISRQSVGTVRELEVDDGSERISIAPNGLQRYEGEVTLGRPGVYTVAIQATYDTADGTTATVDSPELRILRVADDAQRTTVPSMEAPVCAFAGFPASGRPSLLSDVSVDTGTVRFQFEDRLPALRVEEVTPPITEQPSGMEIDVAGSTFLAVTMAPAAAVDLSGSEPIRTYEGPDRIASEGGPIVEVVKTEDSGSILAWVVGVDPGTSFGMQMGGRTLEVRVDAE